MCISQNHKYLLSICTRIVIATVIAQSICLTPTAFIYVSFVRSNVFFNVENKQIFLTGCLCEQNTLLLFSTFLPLTPKRLLWGK